MERIEKRNIADACRHYAMVCGANKNLYRTIPSVIDGLKPGARRILYACYTAKNTNNGRELRKSASIVGDTMGKYHPHGDSAIYDTLVGMAQSWNTNAPSIFPKGNFGDISGNPAAKMRYTNAAISKYGFDCFFSEFEDIPIDMKEAYTGKDFEPEWLPAKYPHALFNGSLSIGYGLASNIPPYNVTEVLETCIKLIKNPDIDVVLYPDLPTGCLIVDDGQFEEISKTGTGTFDMEGEIEIDHQNNVITVKSVPYTVTTDSIVDVLSNKETRKWFPEMKDLKDKTKKDKVCIEIYLTQEANPDEFVKKLYKKTLLRKPHPVDIRLIDDYQDFDYNLKSYLLEWLEYRRDIKRSKYNNLLTVVMEKKHINDILLFIMNKDNAEKTVKIMKDSDDRKEAAEKLMKKYGITSLQALNIAKMPMDSFTKNAYKGYLEQDEKLQESIDEYNKYLDSDELIDKIIINELKDGIKKYGSERKSKIITHGDKKSVPKTEHIVAISEDGYAKKLPVDTKSIGKVGKENTLFTAIQINNRDTLLIFDSAGNISKIDVSSIGDSTIDDVGIPLSRYFTVSNRIVLILKKPPKDLIKAEEMFLGFVTKRGYVKRTALTSFANIKDTKKAIGIFDDEDELVSVFAVSGNTSHDVIIYTNKGNGIRLDMDDIKAYGPSARGLKALNLEEDEYVVGSDKIEPSKEYILYVTTQGRVKRTETKYLPKVSRKSETVQLIKLDDGDTLYKIKSVHGDEGIYIGKKYSGVQNISVEDIEVGARVSKAKKVIKLPKGDYIVSVGITK